MTEHRNKVSLMLGQDGLPMDDVSHYEATPEHLRSFDQASDQLSKFKPLSYPCENTSTQEARP
ncbi:hypothetical protein [Solilutibacter pythonis]|uniref:hypothetical protein n=1 Tax=Solilutibacter pythonis TaxID=2483112 RepID=UPI0011C371EC|nr:hypothetical protein [Lysobacter pythonis]